VQDAPVAAGFEHRGLELHPRLPREGRVLQQLDLLDVVAELVDPTEPFVDAVALVGGEQLVAGQLGPHEW
jgi:hypothetical protein